jgi:hypothetical protein
MIMLSHRPGDGDAMAARFSDSLRRNFGRGSVSTSAASAGGPGPVTPASISQSLERCAVLLVLAGPRWLPEGAQPASWVNNPQDPTRVEIEMALQRHIPTLLVLTHGAVAPTSNLLPPELLPLLAEPGLLVRDDPDYPLDLHKVTQRLQQWVPILPEDNREGPQLSGHPSLRAALRHVGVMFVLYFVILAVAIGVGLPLGLVTVGAGAHPTPEQQQHTGTFSGVLLLILLLIYLATLFLAGRSASLRTGQIVSGNAAGLLAGLITSGTLAVLLVVAAVGVLNAPQNSVGAAIGSAIVYALAITFALVGFLVSLVLGAALGTLGGVFGSRARRRMQS